MLQLHNYFKNLSTNFKSYHSNLLKKTTKDDIHKLRTTLKKIRTFNILLDALLSNKKDFPINLIELFKKCGKIRDIQIQRELLKSYDDDYTEYIQKKYESMLLNFSIKDDLSDDLKYIENKINKVLEYHTEEQITNNIKEYINLCYSNIYNLSKTISYENLHEIRTQVKRLYYTNLMVGELNNIKKIDIIQETIGLWHDYDVTIQNIIKYDNNLDSISILNKKRDSLYNESLNVIKEL